MSAGAALHGFCSGRVRASLWASSAGLLGGTDPLGLGGVACSICLPHRGIAFGEDPVPLGLGLAAVLRGAGLCRGDRAGRGSR